jgi:uncharacterized phiE125 gp8 family phage protein
MMTWALVRTTEPAEPAVSTEDAKLHLRVVHDDEDALIDRIVAAATEQCEEFQGRAFLTQTFMLTLPRFPRGRAIRLPRPPLQAVDKIEYLNTDGDVIEFDSNSYRAVTGIEPGHVMLTDGNSWPSTARGADAVRVTFTAGYGEPHEIPAAARSAVLLLVGHLYENRETVTVGTGPTFRLPMGPEYLLSPKRFRMPDPLGAD